ncbi:nitroreductase family protein [Candidatus Bathyarchaeota archaeon]|nr:nitroreductase family protein [Candidatus Bathyarchaeota archaeon]
MEFFDVVKSRRSIRSFKKQALTQEVINQLIDAARLAPSAGNAQSWAFVLVTKPEIKQALVVAALGQKWLEDAAVVFVVCADLNRAEESYDERGKSLYCIQDTSAAVENILLAATALGLGACWMGAFREEEIRKVINAPNGMRPVALIPVGVPNESPRARSRRSANEVVYMESF